MKLPKLCLPTFNGDPLKWGVFWKQYHTTVHDNDQLDNHQKLTYLREVIKDSKVSHLLNHPTTTAHQYDKLVTLIKERYDQKRLVHKHFTMTIVDYPAIKQGTYEEFCMFSDTIEHSINCLKDAKQYEIGSFIASILTTKLPKRRNDQWLHFTRDTPNVPDIDTQLEFIKEKRNTTSPSTLAPAAKTEPSKESSRRPPRASVYHLQPNLPPRERQDLCTACGEERHPLYFCNIFKAMPMDAKQNHVRTHRQFLTVLLIAIGLTNATALDVAASARNTTLVFTGMVHTQLLLILHPLSLPTDQPQQTATVNSTSSATQRKPTLQMTSLVILESSDGR